MEGAEDPQVENGCENGCSTASFENYSRDHFCHMVFLTQLLVNMTAG